MAGGLIQPLNPVPHPYEKCCNQLTHEIKHQSVMVSYICKGLAKVNPRD
jgi:hypothetical protein